MPSAAAWSRARRLTRTHENFVPSSKPPGPSVPLQQLRWLREPMTDSTEQQKPAINTKQPKSTIDTKTLSEVANRVDLVSVRLVKVAAELKSTSEAPRPLSLNFSYKTSWVRAD